MSDMAYQIKRLTLKKKKNKIQTVPNKFWLNTKEFVIHFRRLSSYTVADMMKV